MWTNFYLIVQGNDYLHQLTSKQPSQLRIELEDLDGVNRYAKYRTFEVESKTNEYSLTLGGYEGDCGEVSSTKAKV